MDDMTLAYAFEDGSDSFVHGFELGRLDARIAAEKPLPIDCGWKNGFPLHTENIGTIQRMAAYHGYVVETRPTEHSEWTAVLLTFRGRAILTVV